MSAAESQVPIKKSNNHFQSWVVWRDGGLVSPPVAPTRTLLACACNTRNASLTYTDLG